MAGDTATATTTTKSARRTYSAEELQRLRFRVSQPRLREAIEEHDGEDAELVKGMSLPLHSRTDTITTTLPEG
jgi:hypothetical protein